MTENPKIFDPHSIGQHGDFAIDHVVYVVAMIKPGTTAVPDKNNMGGPYLKDVGMCVAAFAEHDEALKFCQALRIETRKPFQVFQARLAVMPGIHQPIH